MNFKLYKSRNDWLSGNVAMLVIDSKYDGAVAVADRIGANHVERASDGRTWYSVNGTWIAA